MRAAWNGKVLMVDLTRAEVREQQLPEELYRDFIGAVGLGVRLIYEYEPPVANALGEESVLGFMPGLLTGTAVPSSSRLTIVSKSPLTGGWGDSNVGGYIASELKRAGYDGVLFWGISPYPVYLLIYGGKVELRDASHLWGKDTKETGEILRREIGDGKLRVVCIGPAGENLSFISAIITEEGRAAARSGLGAVMGSKRLKAIVVRGGNRVPVADAARVQELRSKFIKDVKETKIPFIGTLKTMGTAGSTEIFINAGATPFKNWTLIGPDAMSSYSPYGPRVNAYLLRRTTCSECPIVCGGVLRLNREAMSEYHRPEYETIAGFGPMCLNNDVISIIRANDVCNRYGLDTISAATTIAFAIECYQRGLISVRDTDGIELAWGDSSGILDMLEKIARRQGFGAVLADGVKKAAERIGHGADDLAVHVGGQELGFHDPRQLPSRGTGYICDPTPGRHTTFFAGTILERGGLPGPYQELWETHVDLRDYEHKAPTYSTAIKYEQVVASCGLCKFAALFQPTFPLLEFITAATGWDFSLQEMLLVGERIQTMRQLYNVREEIEPRFELPFRVSQPATTGPFRGIPVDFDALRRQYYKSMGWDSETGYPVKSRLVELGLERFASDLPE